MKYFSHNARVRSVMKCYACESCDTQILAEPHFLVRIQKNVTLRDVGKQGEIIDQVIAGAA